MQKFVDCRTKDASRRELYIVEGDSAMGAVKTSRDSEYQAIMPIRGKILNCLKADYARIFKSDVIVDLIKVMGCGVELGASTTRSLQPSTSTISASIKSSSVPMPTWTATRSAHWC